jgi:hypothetical protein
MPKVKGGKPRPPLSWEKSKEETGEDSISKNTIPQKERKTHKDPFFVGNAKTHKVSVAGTVFFAPQRIFSLDPIISPTEELNLVRHQVG